LEPRLNDKSRNKGRRPYRGFMLKAGFFNPHAALRPFQVLEIIEDLGNEDERQTF